MKKLLLLLLCLPMIGFGQDDKIIFSSGDTIYGKVIEVGINNITYQHKDEATKNVSKKSELAKVIYSSGRTETFEGLMVKDFQEKKYNNRKIRLQRREERKSTLSSFGLIGGINNSNIIGEGVDELEFTDIEGELAFTEETKPRIGFYLGAFLTKNYLGLKWIPQIIFQQKGMTKLVPDGLWDVSNVLEKLQANYITLAVNASFEIADIEFAVGPCVSYAVTGESIVWDFPKNGNVYTRNVSIKEDELFSRTEFGGNLGVSYYINNLVQICANYEMSFTPVYKNTNNFSKFGPEGAFYYSALKFGLRYRLGNGL